ncbi:DUF3219 domain-containing protein [Bacillus sp. M6-12]|uniref:DUF3219 family protein n=1 Tax=Bacillus sp. M6-12 TaxID=2054166 RepID=UPI000C772D9F|nr:DUF3219 family protein [Bacillus sp. M6-12]PLS18512.1 DUF3219 domain-containing protein [Bacillus sp. M6-12]
MADHILLNSKIIKINELRAEKVIKNGKEVEKIIVDFQVNHSEYHDITTLLYENDFDVEVPSHKLKFKGTIHNYSTSVTNLYEADAVGIFHLELIER